MVEVNLLPGDDLEQKPGGKFLKWALSWGKRIVILTEGIVILAFLSRFWLDTTVADLADEITTRKNVIDSSANFEKKFRATTDRIDRIKVAEKLNSPMTILDKTENIIPAGILISQMTVSPSKFSFSGSGDEKSLAILVSNFRKSPDFTDLTVDQISKSGTGLPISFSMEATYVKN